MKNIREIKAEDLSNLFEFCKRKFREYIAEFASYGIRTEKDLKFLRGEGMLCYYDLKDSNIYISFPDYNDPLGKVQFLFIRSLLNFDNNDDLARFIFLMMPRLIAHELGHYYRHLYGLFGNDLWYEEQVANRLANAVTKHRFETDEKQLLLDYLNSSIDFLSKKLNFKNLAVDSYHSPLHALNITGLLATNTMKNIQLVNKLFSINPEYMLKQIKHISKKGLSLLHNRKNVIGEFNEEYTSNVMKYFYYQFGWMLLDIESRERHYVDEFLKIHLDRREKFLPVPELNESPSRVEILSCYKAYKETLEISETGARYFYKRYRSLLLANLQSARMSSKALANTLKRESKALLDEWDEKELDTLSLIMYLAPSELRELFPDNIDSRMDELNNGWERNLCQTGRKIRNFLVKMENDLEAEKTLSRLKVLDKIDLFKSLPAESLIDLAQSFYIVRCNPGETIIREGSNNDDVFILIEGELDASIKPDGKTHSIGLIQPGEVFGEMSFFTREVRSATVRAVRESLCYVLRASDLRISSFKNPTILLQIARVLSMRLKKQNLLVTAKIHRS